MISTTRTIGADIRALERHLEQLRTIRQEIDTKRGLRFMGPGSAGIEALDALNSLIESYEAAIGQLSDDFTKADISESTARMFAASGVTRRIEQEYLRDLIAGHRADSHGTRRTAQ